MPNSELLDALSSLRAYHLPSPVSWWPPAPGWWFMVLAITIILISLVLMWWRRQRQLRPSLYAKQELAALQSALMQHGDSEHCLRELSKLLRRFALTIFPRHQVAGLIGVNWLEFLDLNGGEGKFQSHPGNLLAQAPYSRKETNHCLELISLVEQWINYNKYLNVKKAETKNK